MGLTLPFVLLIIDYFKRRKLDAYAYLEKVPFLFMSIGITVISLIYSGFSVNSEGEGLKYFLSIPYQISFYLNKVLFPLKLSCLYPDPTAPEALRLPYLSFSPVALLVLTATVLFSQRYTRKIIFGSIFFLFLLFPVFFSHAHYKAAYIIADHFAYLALIGIFYMLAEGFFWFYRRKATSLLLLRVILILAAFLAVATLSNLTWKRCKVWRDSITLWSDTLKNYPNNIVAYNNRGLAYLKKGEYEKASGDFNQTTRSNINYYGRDKAVAKVFYNLNLSGLYNSTGKYPEAITLLENAIKNDPAYGYNYYNNLAIAYASVGKTNQAITLLNKAIDNNNLKDKSSFYYNLGLIYEGIGNYNEARSLFEKSIASNPSFAEAYHGLGKLYNREGDITNAIFYYKKAITYSPSNENFYNDLAAAYYFIGNYKDAIALLKKALEINPNFIDAYNNLGSAYCAAGKNKQAIAALKKAIQLNPKIGEAHNNIALAYYYNKEYGLAIKHCDMAMGLGYKVNPRLLELLRPYRK
jgi:tetratricopeptide (TPR) repeat protein